MDITDKYEVDERVSSSRHRVAVALNLLEATSDELDAACRQHGWDDGVVLQIQDAARNLGFSLATLYRWYDYTANGGEEK